MHYNCFSSVHLYIFKPKLDSYLFLGTQSPSSFAHFRHDGCDAGVKGHLLVFRGNFSGSIEIIMDRFHGVHDFLALLSVVLLPVKLLEIGLIRYCRQ